MTDKQPQVIPQAPGAPAWNEKPKAGGLFATLLLAAGMTAALLPSEARKLNVYKDSAGIDTVCMGLIGPVTKRHPAVAWTVEECQKAESEYVAPMIAEMQQCIPMKVQREMSYGEWIMFGHWHYNTGAFCSSSVGRNLEQGNHEAACRSMGAYTWITWPMRKLPLAGTHKIYETKTNTGLVKVLKVDCKDPKNKCSGLAKRRDLEVTNCLNAL